MPQEAKESTCRLVVLTGNGPEHRYVANRLCSALPVEAIVVDVTVRRPSLHRAFRGGTRRGLSRVLRELFLRAVRDQAARDAAMRRVFGEDLIAGFVAEGKVIEVQGVNSPKAISTVTCLRPDAILVYGTAIVSDEMLSQAHDIAFNMHTGISPQYRGTDCAFWPAVNRELERIGATVHECTSSVDAGPIFAVGAAVLYPDDRLHDLFARAVVKGAELYIEAVRKYLAGELKGEPQDLSIGREYRGYARTLLPELSARWALRRGLLRRDSPRGRDVSTLSMG